MRYSLRHLLLLVPAWIAAFYLAPFATLVAERITYRHMVAANDVRQIRLWAATEMADNPVMHFSEYDANVLWTELGGHLDPWGNEYQVVELNRTGVVGSPSSFHAYSMGADGNSKSNGNDADDINSWDYDFARYYRPMILAEQTHKHIWRTLWLTPIIYLACLSVFRLFRTSTTPTGG